MIKKRVLKTRNLGYISTTLGQLIPGGIISSYNRKINQQIKELHEKEQQYIESMSGECVTYRRENE